MKKSRLLLMMMTLLVAAQAWAADNAVITTNVEAVDFGDIEVGYPISKSFMVTGYQLTDDIVMTIEGRGCGFFALTSSIITPEAAAMGANVTVTCNPFSKYMWPASIRLSSSGAEDVIISLTATASYLGYEFMRTRTEEFYAPPGGMQARSGYFQFFDVEVPTDPNLPVDRAWGPTSGDYSVSVEGADANQFMARIVKSSSITNVCTVQVTYLPNATGTHEATLKLYCARAGVPENLISLRGEAWGTLGDIDDDGLLGIGDVTGIVTLLLKGNDGFPRADLNCDGELTITDVTLLITRLLEGD